MLVKVDDKYFNNYYKLEIMIKYLYRDVISINFIGERLIVLSSTPNRLLLLNFNYYKSFVKQFLIKYSQ